MVHVEGVRVQDDAYRACDTQVRSSGVLGKTSIVLSHLLRPMTCLDRERRIEVWTRSGMLAYAFETSILR